mgnify:CR=1 FL=1|jgi:HPr kinase/phosphorylase
MKLVHGTCIAIGASGVLLRGAPGAGKSDLALRLLGQAHLGARLVADDQVQLTRRGDEIWAQAPPRIAGLMEVRGIGIVHMAAAAVAAEARLRLVLELYAPGVPHPVPRMPEDKRCTIDGIDLPLYPCIPFEASAPDKVALLVRSLDEDILQG